MDINVWGGEGSLQGNRIYIKKPKFLNGVHTWQYSFSKEKSLSRHLWFNTSPYADHEQVLKQILLLKLLALQMSTKI